MSYITAIGKANPANKVKQSDIADFMIRAMQLNGADARKMRTLSRLSGIGSRHSVLEDYGKKDGFEFYSNTEDLEPFPSTKARMHFFRDSALKLSEAAISDCLTQRGNFRPETITHIIVVSCTGMYAPGLDVDIIRSLGLSLSIRRLCINFMGCYAAFNALRLADSFCNHEAGARVLVVCTELCSLHFQKENSEDNMLANTLFADGSAAILVESGPCDGLNLVPLSFYCDIAMDGAEEMAWTVGDLGFEMKLSSYVPEIIRNGIRQLTDNLLGRISQKISDVAYFAMHPGGKKILEAVEEELGLTKEQNDHAYAVLKDYGNMSSPTVLFVLHSLCAGLGRNDSGKKILSFAFGPGLTLESMLLKIVYH